MTTEDKKKGQTHDMLKVVVCIMLTILPIILYDLYLREKILTLWGPEISDNEYLIRYRYISLRIWQVGDLLIKTKIGVLIYFIFVMGFTYATIKKIEPLENVIRYIFYLLLAGTMIFVFSSFHLLLLPLG